MRMGKLLRNRFRKVLCVVVCGLREPRVCVCVCVGVCVGVCVHSVVGRGGSGGGGGGGGEGVGGGRGGGLVWGTTEWFNFKLDQVWPHS